MSNGKATIILLIAGLIKKNSYIKWVIFQNYTPTVKTKKKLN